MRRAALIGGAAVLVAAVALAASRAAFTGHMIGHMGVVAGAAPLLAIGLAGGPGDAARRWPTVVTPLAMSVLELVVVWGWHAPAARAWSGGSGVGFVAEQASFVAAGVLLWSACLTQRHAGVVALLLTSMHMTLLGALIALTPRSLFGEAPVSCLGLTLTPLMDQQAGGVAMLMVGAAAYLVGGLALLSGALRGRAAA